MFPRTSLSRSWLLAGLMFCAPLWACHLANPAAVAAPPQALPVAAAPAELPAATSPIAATADPIEMRYVPETAIMGVLVQPARVLTAAEFETAPIEVLQAALLKEIGIDPLHISQALFVSDPPSLEGDEPVPALIVRFSEDYSLEDMFVNQRHNLEEFELEGRPMLVLQEYPHACFYMPNDTTLIVADGDTLDRILAQEAAPETRLVELLEAAGDEHDAVAVFDIEPIRPMLEALKREAPRGAPRPIVRLLELPSLIDAVQIHANLTGGRASTLELIASDDDAAAEAEEIINEGLEFGRQFALAQMEAELAESEDPVEQAMLAYGHRISDHILQAVSPQREGNSLSLTYEPNQNPQAVGAATIGILVALLLPAVNAARDAARRNGAMNQLRQLQLGMLNYESSNGQFPASEAGEGEGLSWRVHLLPYLEQRHLYEQFHLDEPWDSEHNLTLVEQMPDILQSPTAEGEPGYTHFQLVTGEGTAFQDGAEPRISSFRDGTSMTIMLVEADEPVIWTKPADFEYDPENPTRGLGHLHTGGVFLAAFADGSIRAISRDIDPEVLRALFTNDGGEPIPAGGY